MTDADVAVVVGAGQAGSELSICLRQNGFDGRIVLLGEERHMPYQRPPLSKTLLKAGATAHDLRVRSPEAYAASDIDVILGNRVSALDLDARCVLLGDGTRLEYTKLALTTGGRPRALALGDEPLNAASLHALDDALALREHLRPGRRIVVVGAGFIGLEVAAVAAEGGAEVIILEIADRILGRTNPAVVSEFFTRLHRAHGVSVRTGATLYSARRMRNGRISIQLGDGTNISADLILAGIGMIPNDELARAAGLDVSDGILVDSQARTSKPDVVAAGDCTRQFHGLLRREVRLESQQNAVEQARIAARTLCGSTTESFNVPTFWSDQYDHRLQMVGLPLPDDEQVLRGDPDSGSFSVVFLRGGRLSAVHAVGRPSDITAGRKLIATQAHLRPSHDIAIDGPLGDLAVT
ncbi:FAD-dependent oxidoreductase [Mycolicibacterium smegmatis]|uniref:NAD(P)/FAD-dependent oxidoreductase n=1 Tax=Mycolicibacterium smegmatis TaxID=1772 RepID=UPI001E539F0C|nr:FAD-dependent oxidoreductase [Mycolicibacterium smegmatis]UGU33131.1 FAD-dependent oxidoreductase [Mycolicibacterium smegmatis]ULN68009.1 FAD-dependent oxidoreductase [Mycolicibacterium smegmatis]